ncbi:hypothetical protein D9M73_88950 [compost metagenome]
MLDGSVHTAHKTFTNDAAHAAAHEVEFKTAGNHTNAVHGATHDDQCIGFAGVFQRLFQAFGVLAAVLELEGIDRQDFLAQLVTAFGIQKGIQPGARAYAVVVAALRADILVFLQVGLVEHGFAAGALDPQALGHATALGGVSGRDFGWEEFF